MSLETAALELLADVFHSACDAAYARSRTLRSDDGAPVGDAYELGYAEGNHGAYLDAERRVRALAREFAA